MIISTSDGRELYLKAEPCNNCHDVMQTYANGLTHKSFFNSGQNILIRDYKYTGSNPNPLWLQYGRLHNGNPLDVWFTAQSITW